MPHICQRFATQLVEKYAKFWPVVGVLGFRQAGKSTLIQKILQVPGQITLDDLFAREEAMRSPQAFLSKLGQPSAIDEIQKAPPLFDAIKLRVDQQRTPGRYYLTGSSSFSAKLGIRESLTGRIGLIELLPFTLAELHELPFHPLKTLSQPLTQRNRKPRFTVDTLSSAMLRGGMPVPLFTRDANQRRYYWREWLETTIYRDLAQFFKRGFDADYAFRLLEDMAVVLRQGALPTVKHFKGNARKIRNYLSAMEDIFLLRKINCHPAGIGKEIWLFKDSGLAHYLMQQSFGDDITLSLARHYIWNELSAQAEYQGKRLSAIYYKSAAGSASDFILDGIPFRIVATPQALMQQRSWEERALRGAMKTLNAKIGFLVGPIDHAELPAQSGGIGVLPWSAWS